jgi:hypothetical protein
VIGATLALMLLIGAETTYLFSTGRVDGPLWFEAGAGIVLAGAVLLAAWLWALKFPPQPS